MLKKVIKYCVSRMGFLLPIKSKMSVKEARQLLNEFSSKPTGTCYTQNFIDLQYDLQIIIPAYNVEKFIKQCVESVLIQKSEYKILVVIINDGSTDLTSIILDKIKKDNEFNENIQLEIVNQSNKGFSGARNTGLKCLKGRYIMLLESDDILPENTIKTMMDHALKTNADIIQGSWYDFNGDIKKEHIVNVKSKNISGYPWGKLYKHTILENFKFPEGYWFEDTPISYIIAGLPLNIVLIDDIIYGYRLNINGFTAKSLNSKKSIDSYWITELCLEEFSKFNLQYNQRAFEYLLNQCLINHARTRNQPQKINEAQFIMEAYLVDKYFADFKTSNKNLYLIQMALRNKSYLQFKFFSL